MTEGLTRRGLIGGAAAAGLAGATATRAEARARVRRYDVVVVGAGLSGLAAARTLRARGKSVLVVEARDRVGGRTLNHSVGGGKVVEVGGQWVGPTQDHLLALAKELGIKTFPTYNTGKNVYLAEGLRLPYTGAVPPSPTALPDVARAFVDLDSLAKTIPREAPWKAPRATEFDGQTFETYKGAHTTTPAGRFLLDLAIESVWAAEPRDVSLLHVLFYIACAGNEKTPGTLERLVGVVDGAQERRFVGGSQRISLEMARRLGKDRIALGHPVRRIEQHRGFARVIADGLTVEGRQVVVTAPPALTALIDYSPPLPVARAQLTQRFPQGSAIKVQAVYDRPFWRDKGLTGQITTDGAPVRITFDNSPPDGKPGVMLGFIEGQAARVYGAKSAAARKAAVLRQFQDFFGAPGGSPKQYFEMNWGAEQWTRGCYVGYTPPGVLLDYGEAIRRPVGRIHWAGAEMATLWNGYMDGAVRSGQAVAAEVLAAL